MAILNYTAANRKVSLVFFSFLTLRRRKTEEMLNINDIKQGSKEIKKKTQLIEQIKVLHAIGDRKCQTVTTRLRRTADSQSSDDSEQSF